MKRKKCFKCFATLLAVLMLCAMLPTVALASVVDVDEGEKDGVTITRNYDTTIVIFMEEVDAEGNILNKNLGSYSVDNHLDLDSEEGQAVLSASKETALAEFSAKYPKYEIYDQTDSTRISYTCPQVDEGGTFSSVDDLVNAYIAAGSVSESLDINKFESYRIIYHVLNKDATETTPEPQAVSTINVANATLDIKPGEAPKFTAESSEPELYYVYLEMWNEVGSDKYITSHDFFNRDEELLIKQFEEGKEYTYSVWVKPYSVYADNGDFLYYATTLSDCNKLVLNGEDIPITAEMTEDNEEAGIWLYKVVSSTAENPAVPGTTDPGTTDPGTTDPGTTDPGTTDPGTTDPGTTDPGTTNPGTTNPGTTDLGHEKDDVPKTGDTNSVGMVFALITMVFASACGIVLTLRKKESR